MSASFVAKVRRRSCTTQPLTIRGVFIFAGHSFEWQIEYRGADGTGVAADPADPDKTFRVLTLYARADVLVRSEF
jgi:hypothetical protein